MGSLSDVLREARSRSGLSHAQLADKLGVNRVTAFNREAGKHDMPASSLVAVAEATGQTLIVSSSGFRLLETERHEMSPNPERDQPLSQTDERPYRLPLLGVASAGPGSWQDDGPVENVSIANRWLTKLDGVVQVHGDSMEPLLSDGDLVGVRLGEEFAVGDVVIAVASYGECLLKVFGGVHQEDGLVILTSINQTHPPVVGRADEIAVQGVAYGLLRAERLRV